MFFCSPVVRSLHLSSVYFSPHRSGFSDSAFSNRPKQDSHCDSEKSSALRSGTAVEHKDPFTETAAWRSYFVFIPKYLVLLLILISSDVQTPLQQLRSADPAKRFL